jgi:hypothetical protein
MSPMPCRAAWRREARTWLVSKPCVMRAASCWPARLPAIEADDPGPAGFAGSLIVAEFGSQPEARAWADADPYVAAKVYRSVEIHPFRRVLP